MDQNDMIYRQAAIDAMGIEPFAFSEYENGLHDKWEADVEALMNLPSAQSERKKGRWEMKPDPYGFFKEIPVCSECGCTTKWREKYLYCPTCGTPMEGEQDG